MLNINRRRVIVVILTALALLALPALFAPQPLHAQGIIIDPPFPPFPPPMPPPHPPRPLPPVQEPVQATLTLHSVDAVIDGPVAQVRVKQVFRNDTGGVLEGTYIFPLPADAAVGDFSMTVNGEVLEGKVLEADEARRIYEEIVRNMRDPALLEYVDHGLFQASVFPIPPNEERTVELSYSQVLPQENGLYRFDYPLRTHAFSAAPVDTLSVRVELVNQPGLRTVYSPSHEVSIDRTGDDGALIGLEESGKSPTGNFTLYFGTARSAVGANVLTYAPSGEDGYFVLLAAPGLALEEQEVVARDIVLVLDVSGSMQGEKIEQARQAAAYLVDNLNPEDRFNLITFSTGVKLWERELQEVTSAATADAHAWIKRVQASGSTDINRALLEALALLDPESERPAYVLFMTDGLPTAGETDAFRIYDNAFANLPGERSVRLFTFGVGYDVNTLLLDSLSRDLGGKPTYVQPGERIDEAVSGFYAGVSTPVLSNVELDLGEAVTIEDAYPFPLPDLFAGEQLVVAGRYRLEEEGPVTLKLRGEVNGAPVTYVFPGMEFAERGGEPAVARLWATRKIASLLESVRRIGPERELIDEIVQLSLEYGIVTPYTSYLVTEPSAGFAGQAGAVDGAAAVAPPPMDLRPAAEAAAAQSLDAYAAAAPSGAEAVQASIAQEELRSATVTGQTEGVRYVAGKTFTRQSTVQTDAGPVEFWVDTAYEEGMELTTVIFGSEEYFELAADPDMAAWLALSPEMILVQDDTALRITTSSTTEEGMGEGGEAQPGSPVATPVPSGEDDD